MNIKDLLKKHKNNTLNDQERIQLHAWYNEQAEPSSPANDLEVARRLAQIENRLPNLRKTNRSRNWKFLFAAASLLLLASFGYYIYVQRAKPTPEHIIIHRAEQASKIIAAGKKLLSLDSLLLGDTIRLDHVLIHKDADGTLVYKAAPSSAIVSQYHTLETPVGGEMTIVLSDGTKVWLNSASRLTFPLNMDIADRKLQLSGEAYFDVSRRKDMTGKQQRFIVNAEEQQLEVLGTTFNLRAYPNEDKIETSLRSGSVKISNKKAGAMEKEEVYLLPGQKSTWNKSEGSMTVTSPTKENVTAWKEGYFSFNGDNVKEVCQQLSRWYKVEFDYAPTLQPGSYYGEIPKSYSLNEVLDILVLESLNYTITTKNGKTTIHLNNNTLH